MARPTLEIGGRARRLGLAAATLMSLASGCGDPPGPPRVPVSGKVTLDGQPLTSGSVTFLPDKEGAPAGGTIEGGSFSLGPSDGPSVGTYRVEINSVQPTGRQVPSPDDRTATIEEVRDVVPPRYNARTELRAEVKPDGENSFRFELSSRPERSRPGAGRIAGAIPRNKGRTTSAYVE